jgi:hypothetical protein
LAITTILNPSNLKEEFCAIVIIIGAVETGFTIEPILTSKPKYPLGFVD